MIEGSKQYADWNFFYASVSRKVAKAGNTTDVVNDDASAVIAKRTMFSFVNLCIAADCDFFVGALGSPWAQILNELRLTGGRLNAGHLAVSFDQL